MSGPFRGESTELGPTIDTRQAAHVRSILDEAMGAGAGAGIATAAPAADQFIRPTVLTDVTPDMRAWSDEIFGPVAPRSPTTRSTSPSSSSTRASTPCPWKSSATSG